MPNINKVVYDGNTLIDLTDTTATAETIRQGYTAYGADGEKVTGTYTGVIINNQNKNVTPTESQQSISADSGYTGLGTVTVSAIPSDYVGSGIDQRDETDLTASGATVTIPSGYYAEQETKTIDSGALNSNITYNSSRPSLMNAVATVNPAGYIDSSKNISRQIVIADVLPTQSATTITPTESEQTAVSQYKWTTGDVKVGAISSTYVGSGITQRDETDLTASGATVSVPAGYYAEAASKSVASGTAGTPIATKGTVSNHSISVTPSVTNTTGYITGSTKTGTAVTVSASELVSGTLTIDSSGTKDVTNYASVSVDAGTATNSGTASVGGATVTAGTNSITLSKSVPITPDVTAGYISSGTSGNVSVSLTGSVTTKGAATYTPTTTDQTIASGTYLTGTQIIAGDADLVASNIKKDVDIFGVTGTYEPSLIAKTVTPTTAGLIVTPNDTIETNIGNPSRVVGRDISFSAGNEVGITTSGDSILSFADGLGKTVHVVLKLDKYSANGTWRGRITIDEIVNIPSEYAPVEIPITDASIEKIVFKQYSYIQAFYLYLKYLSSPSETYGYTEVYSFTLKEVSTTNYDGLSQVTVNGDNDLIADNIKSGVEIFGVTGTYQADTGAVADRITTLQSGGDWHDVFGVDLTEDTVAADKLLSGYTAHDSAGNAITGVLATKSLTVTPTTSTQTYSPNDSFADFSHTFNYGSKSANAGGGGTIDDSDADLLSIGSDYRFIGTVVVFDGENNTLQTDTFDTIITFSTSSVKIYSGEDDDYLTYFSIYKLTTDVSRIRFNFQYHITGNYGITISFSVYDARTYVGYNQVTVNAFNGYEESVIKNYIERNTLFTGITWPDNITKIGDFAFAGCTWFQTTSLPNTITSLGQYAFSQCSRLALTSLPANIVRIPQYCFYYCSSLALTALPSNVSTIEGYAFQGCSNITLTSLPNGITELGTYAFQYCQGITSMTFPDNFVRFYNGCFNGCYNLRTVSGNGAITGFSNNVFNGASYNGDQIMSLQSISFPNAVASTLANTIGSSTANYACQNLQFADIGSTQALGGSAFGNCYALETLILRRSDDICALNYTSAFTNTPMSGYNSKTGTVYVPSALISTYQTATNWSTLYNAGTVTFVAIEGSEYELD